MSSTLSVRTRWWTSPVRSVLGVAFGRAVGSSWGGSVWQRPVRPAVVVLGDEDLEQGLELGERGRLDRLGA
ncbi:hypothetical protein [Kribbella pratensis]|uniref:hypothetical protein n=1 Tax=Kribbella pratensis TaxID=2512112 RepID=UPI00192D87B7|nr:hypothetical protein [Kribbella pratensis]